MVRNPPGGPQPWGAALALALLLGAAMPLPAGSAATGNSTPGGLTLDGNDVLVVEDRTLTVRGDVILRGASTLVLRGATLRVDQASPHQFGIHVHDRAALLLLDPDAAIASPHPVTLHIGGHGRLRTEGTNLTPRLVAGDHAAVEAHGTTFLGGLEARGQATLRIVGGKVPTSAGFVVRDAAAADVEGAWVARGAAHGQATVAVRNATFPYELFRAFDRATLRIEHSRTLGFEGCCELTPFRGDPTVVLRHVAVAASLRLDLDGGNYTFLDTPVRTWPTSRAHTVHLGDGVTLEGQRFERVRVVEGSAILAGRSMASVVVEPGASPSLRLPGHPVLALLEEPFRGTVVDNLLLRSGASLAFGAGLHLVRSLNDECYLAMVGPDLTPATLRTGLPLVSHVGVPGANADVLVAEALNQTLRVRVEDAAGAPVPGATVTLRDALGEPVPVHDPHTGATSPLRTTDAAGLAEYLFAPTGVLRVDARGPDGREGSADAVTATCAEATVRLAEA